MSGLSTITVRKWDLTDIFSCTGIQGKEYVFIANSDNLGATVDLSILLYQHKFARHFFSDSLYVVICSNKIKEASFLGGIHVPLVTLTIFKKSWTIWLRTIMSTAWRSLPRLLQMSRVVLWFPMKTECRYVMSVVPYGQDSFLVKSHTLQSPLPVLYILQTIMLSVSSTFKCLGLHLDSYLSRMFCNILCFLRGLWVWNPCSLKDEIFRLTYSFVRVTAAFGDCTGRWRACKCLNKQVIPLKLQFTRSSSAYLCDEQLKSPLANAG